MQQRKVNVLRLFEQQLEEGKTLFEDLTRKIRSKKAIILEEKLLYFQITLELIGKIHFEEKTLSLKFFSPFDLIYRNLKKITHVKLIESRLEQYMDLLNDEYPRYAHELSKNKKAVYTDAFDCMTAAPLKIWEDLYVAVHSYSKDLSPLQLNTASTQLINDEVTYANLDVRDEMAPQALKGVHDSLRKIILLEKIRLNGGLNPVFTFAAHEKIQTLLATSGHWHQHHLFFQHYIHFLRDKEGLEKKYLILAKHVKKQHKEVTEEITKRCTSLFAKVLT